MSSSSRSILIIIIRYLKPIMLLIFEFLSNSENEITPDVNFLQKHIKHNEFSLVTRSMAIVLIDINIKIRN